MNPINNAGNSDQYHRQEPAGQSSGSLNQLFGHNSPFVFNINQFQQPGSYQVSMNFSNIQEAQGGQHAYRQPDVHLRASAAGNNTPWPTSPVGYGQAPINQLSISPSQGVRDVERRHREAFQEMFNRPFVYPLTGVSDITGQGHRLGFINEQVPAIQSSPTSAMLENSN